MFSVGIFCRGGLFASVFFFNSAVGDTAQIPILLPSGTPEISRSCLFSEAEGFLDRHKWSDARDCYLDIIKNDSTSVAVWMGLATALTYLGHREDALKQLIRAVDQVKVSHRTQLVTKIRVLSRLFLTNATFQVYQDGLILLDGKKFKPSQEKFEKALSEEVDNVEILLRMGQSTLLDGSPKEALLHLKLAKKLDPFDPEIQLWLGKAYQMMGNVQGALSELKEAYYSFKGSRQETDNNREASTVWYADALVGSGQIGAALGILTQDFKYNPYHLRSLVTAVRLRAQASKSDLLSWNMARKEINLALKKLEQAKFSDSASSSQIQDNFAFIQEKTPDEIKAEILGFIKQTEALHPLRRS